MNPFVVVLGIAQDGGRPQAGCDRTCCAAAWADPALHRRPACLGIVDPGVGAWLVDATPALPSQLHELLATSPGTPFRGVLLTHAHAGHYTGLVHLGREVAGGSHVPVYAMPRMRAFLQANAPWELLFRLGHADLLPAEDGVVLSERVRVSATVVPHRGEYTETVAFTVEGPDRRVLWLPDIDAWDGFPLQETVGRVDRAFLDGTFYADGELPRMASVPHPRMLDTLARLELAENVQFIHLNHTNPAMGSSRERNRIEGMSASIATEGERYGLAATPLPADVEEVFGRWSRHRAEARSSWPDATLSRRLREALEDGQPRVPELEEHLGELFVHHVDELVLHRRFYLHRRELARMAERLDKADRLVAFLVASGAEPETVARSEHAIAESRAGRFVDRNGRPSAIRP
jgi:pyrroloquinoline quinone biosynthesis protein B